MPHIDEQTWVELRRKAALYDEAMKQEPVAEVNADMSGAYILPSTLRPGQALYARPIPPPDVRELVRYTRALYSYAASRSDPDTRWEAPMMSGARAALAPWENKP